MKNLKFQSLKPTEEKGKTLTSSFSTQLLQEVPDLSKIISKKLPFIFVSLQQLEKQLQINDWRNKTQFPIVKVEKCTLAGKKSEMLKLEVQTEPIVTRLANLSQLPLFQILYLLKESLIALERLYHKFGPFHFTPNMVAINQNMKCKVWVNQRFESNQFIKTFMSEPQFLIILFHLFQKKCKTSKNSTSFFDRIRHCQSFCQAMTFVQNYFRANKIKPLNSLIVRVQKEKSLSKARAHLHSSSLLRKTPKFLEEKTIRISLKLNNQLRIPFGQGFPKLRKSSTKTVSIYKKNSHCTSIRETLASEGFIMSSIDLKPYNNAKAITQSQFHTKISSNFATNSHDKKFNSNIQTAKAIHSCNIPKEHSFFNKNRQKNSYEKHVLGHILDEQDDQSLKGNEKQAHSLNKWQKTFSLVNDNSDLKISVHFQNDQKEYKWKEYPQRKLSLLQKVQTQTCESLIESSNQNIMSFGRIPLACDP